MPFTKKFPKSGETKHIRVPVVYADLVLELMELFERRFDVEKGKHLLKKYINNLSWVQWYDVPPVALALDPLQCRGFSGIILVWMKESDDLHPDSIKPSLFEGSRKPIESCI